MKNKSLRLMVLGMVVVLALLVFVPAASASMVTKIMLAQENVEVFEYTAPSNGQLWIKVDWVDEYGNASSYPVSEVDAGVIGPSGQNLYVDSDIKSLYSGVNGNTGTQTVSSGKKYYICVFPWFGDCTATITMKLGGSGGTNITAKRLSDGATVTSPQTVAASGANGEFYAPSTGDWISTFQYWPGTSSEYYACWNDYVYERIAGTTYDTLAEAYAMIFYQSASGLQVPTRTTLTAAGAAQGPHAQKWYAIGPQIWPAASVPNTLDGGGNVMPGAVAATKAPAWYTYAYPDAAVTTQTPAYTWAMVTNAAASKRAYSLTSSQSAVFTSTFYGPAVRVYYTGLTSAGIAKVTVDGNVVGTIDMYDAAGPAYKKYQDFGGFGATATHTIRIESNKSKNAASSNFATTIDAIGALGFAGDTTPMDENNYAGAFTYTWPKLTSGTPSGGSWCMTSSQSAAVAAEFKGTAVRVVYTGVSSAGVARVYIDGVDKGTIDQYASALTTGLTKDYSGLADTTHIIMIMSNKSKNAASSNFATTIDAFVVNPGGAGTYTIENL